MNEFALAQYINVVFMPSTSLIGGMVIATLIALLLIVSTARIVKFEALKTHVERTVRFSGPGETSVPKF